LLFFPFYMQTEEEQPLSGAFSSNCFELDGMHHQAQMEARRRNSRGSSEPSPEEVGQIPTMQVSSYESIFHSILQFVSTEPFCCQIFFYLCVLSCLGTALELDHYTHYSLKGILENQQYWRLFTWPLASDNVFSNFFSCLFGYCYLKNVEQNLGSCFTGISFLFGYSLLCFVPLSLYPLCAPEFGLFDVDSIRLSGLWAITFFFLTISIITHIKESTWFLCFRVVISKRMNVIFLCICWQILTLGDVGVFLGTIFGFFVIYSFPNFRSVQRLDQCFCCFRKTDAFITLDPFSFVLRERLNKQRRRNPNRHVTNSLTAFSSEERPFLSSEISGKLQEAVVKPDSPKWKV